MANPGSVPSPERLLRSMWGLSVLATVIGAGRHLVDAIAACMPEGGSLLNRLAAVPQPAWTWASLHLICAVASLGVGYLLISLAYPRRHLAAESVGNPAAAIQASAHLLGAATVASVSWGGTDFQSLLVSLVFCSLGWVAVILICAGHRLVTRYRDHEEIAAGNIAAALGSAGLHLAVALVVGHAIQGQFLGWMPALIGFATALAWVLVLYPLRQWVLARLILRMTPQQLDEAVSVRRDIYLGATEGVTYVLAALCLAAGW